MFAVLQIGLKKRWRLAYKSTHLQADGIIFTRLAVSHPKNPAQRRRLNRLLTPFSHRWVPPADLAADSFLVPTYPTTAFCDRVLLQAFVRFCKTHRPECAVLRPSGKVHPDYFLALCPHVGRLIILEEPPDYSLCRLALEQSGTPLLFDGTILSGAVMLDLTAKRRYPYTPALVFSRFDFSTVSPPALSLPSCFSGLDPLILSAALYETTKNHFNLLEAWVEVMLKHDKILQFASLGAKKILQ